MGGNQIQMQFANSFSLLRVGSCAAEAVAVDVMDIMGWERTGKELMWGGGRG